MEGWIKLHRGLLEWEWSDSPEMVSLFVHLLCMANTESHEWHGTNIERGQVITGRKILSKKTGISEQTIRTCINRLKSTNEITTKTTNKYTIITICNFDKYQITEDDEESDINQQINQQLTNNQPTTNQQLTTLKEHKNIRNNNISLSPRARVEGNFSYELDKIEDILINQSSEWKESILRYLNNTIGLTMTIGDIDRGIKDFTAYLQAGGVTFKELDDAKTHCRSYLAKKLNDFKNKRRYEQGRTESMAERLPDGFEPLL